MANGIANSIAKNAAFRVPIVSGTIEYLGSKLSDPDDACQTYSGSERPSYQTRFQSAPSEDSGCFVPDIQQMHPATSLFGQDLVVDRRHGDRDQGLVSQTRSTTAFVKMCRSGYRDYRHRQRRQIPCGCTPA